MGAKLVAILMLPFLVWGYGDLYTYQTEEECTERAMSLYREMKEKDEELAESLFLVLKDSASREGNVCSALRHAENFLKQIEEERKRRQQVVVASAMAFVGVVFLAGAYRRFEVDI